MATSSQVPSTSDARAEELALFYLGSVAASYTTSGGRENTCQPSAPQTDEFLLPPPAAREVEEDGRGGYYSCPDIEVSSVIGSVPPPSYHTQKGQ